MTDHIISIDNARHDLLSCAAYLAEELSDSGRQSEALEAIVPLYLAENNVDVAAELANTAVSSVTRESLLIKVVIKCAEIDDDEYAFQLADAIEDKVGRELALEEIAEVKARQGDFEKALEIAAPIETSSLLGLIAYEKEKSGDEAGAMSLIERINEPDIKSNYLQVIALEKHEKGETEKAGEMIEEAYTESEKLDYLEDKINSLHSVSYSFGKIGRYDRSIEILSKVQQFAETIEGVNRDNRMAEVSLAFFEAGSVDLADRALDQVEDQTQIASTLLGYSQEYWRKDEKTDALETLYEAYQVLKAQHARDTRDSVARFKLFKAITLQFARFSKPETAIEAAVSIPYDQDRAGALAQIAQIFVLQSDDQSVKKATDEIDETGDRAFALIGISDAENEMERRDKAVNYLNEAAISIENVPQVLLRQKLYNETGKRFAAYGLLEKARDAAHKNLQVIRQINDPVIRITALANLSSVYKKSDLELNAQEKAVIESMIDAD